ncbi:Mlr4105 protein [hydrothermal vent metagenome]|uniref:Mlr4105 protein n=1 Tax=hydrothermal vent metagenome TaxID=652676 RepID=A0A3B0R9D4_9ZZZZ
MIDAKDRAIALELEQDEPLTKSQEKYLGVCDEKLGFIPNVLKSYSFNPTKFQAFTDMYNDLMLGPSALSKLEREMLAVAASSINHCYYCLTAHGAAVRNLSDDPKLGEEIVMNYRAADLSERHKAMLDFATLMTQNPEAIEEQDRQELRDAGFSDRDIWDIAAVVSFFNMTNRMATAVDMRPNDEYHAMAR